jgi:hypothetical protein
MVDLDAQRHKIETLATTDRALDTLSGGIVRLYVRVEQLEAEVRRQRARLQALETMDSAAGNSQAGPKIAPSSGREYRGNRTPIWNLKDGKI